jgi:hypothetical protein
MNPRDTPPPITATLGSQVTREEKQNEVRAALDRIGEAFDGIDSYNAAGRNEPLTAALRRFPRQHRVPLTLDTMVALADRINELSNIVKQTALTADDLPQAGWGFVPEPSDPRDPIHVEGTENDYICADCGEPRADASGWCADCSKRHVLVDAAQLSKGDEVAGLGPVVAVANYNDGDGIWVLVTVKTGPTQTRALQRRPDEVVRVVAAPDSDGPEEYADSAEPGDPETTNGGF